MSAHRVSGWIGEVPQIEEYVLVFLFVRTIGNLRIILSVVVHAMTPK